MPKKGKGGKVRKESAVECMGRYNGALEMFKGA